MVGVRVCATIPSLHSNFGMDQCGDVLQRRVFWKWIAALASWRRAGDDMRPEAASPCRAPVLWSFGFRGRGMPQPIGHALNAIATSPDALWGDLDSGLFPDLPIREPLCNAAFACRDTCDSLYTSIM